MLLAIRHFCEYCFYFPPSLSQLFLSLTPTDGIGWTILERKVDVHFTLVSTEYHLCNLNDVHHRSPGKSFLQPLVSLRGLVGSDRWVQNNDELEAMDPSYSSSVHVQNDNNLPTMSLSNPEGGGGSRGTFGGIENSVHSSWSFQVRPLLSCLISIAKT